MIRYIYLTILVVGLYGDELGPHILSVNDFREDSFGNINVKSVVVDETAIDKVSLYYRQIGEDKYYNTEMAMVSDGYVVDIDSDYFDNQIEYYLLAQDDDGNTSRFPEDGQLVSGSGVNIDVTLVSPRAEIEFSDGVPILILSLWDPDEKININDLNISIDNKDITSNSSISFDMITYVPKEIFSAGNHTIEVFLKNKERGKYGSKKLIFNIKEKPVELADVRSGFIDALSPSGGVTWDSDYDEAESRPDDNQKFNAKIKFKLWGADVSVTRTFSTHFIDMDALELLETKQDADRYKISVGSKYLDYSFGDFSPQFSEFTLKGTRIRGHHLRFKLGFFETFITTGETRHVLGGLTVVGTPSPDSLWTHNDQNNNGIIDYYADLTEQITSADSVSCYTEQITSADLQVSCYTEQITSADSKDSCDGLWDEVNEHCYIDENNNQLWDNRLWDEVNEHCYIDENNNQLWDYGVWDEVNGHCYIDENNNQLWDHYLELYESFTDCGYDGDDVRICDDDSEWDPSYGNNYWDQGEDVLELTKEDCGQDASGVWDEVNERCYIDENNNGIWDQAEEFEDTTSASLDGFLLSDKLSWQWSQHSNGTPRRLISGIRTQLNLFKKLKIGANFFKTYDDRSSLNIDDLFIDQYAMYGNFVMGLDMELRLNKNRTVFKAETAFSGINNILSSDSLLTSELGGKNVSNAIENFSDFLGYSLTDDLLLGISEGRGLSVALPTGDDIWNHDDTDGDGEVDADEDSEDFWDCGYNDDDVWLCYGNDDWDSSYGNNYWDQGEDILNLSQDECDSSNGGTWDDSNQICFVDSDGDGKWNQEEIFFDNPIKNINMLSYVFSDVLGRGTYILSFSTPIPIENVKMDYDFELKRVPSNFTSLGNSSIRADYFGFKTGTKIRLWKDQLSFNFSYDRNNDNVNGVNPEDKLKSSTTTSQTINMGSGLNFPGWPILNYSFRSMSREAVNVSADTTTVKNSTLTHTIAPSYKFDTGLMNVNLSSNLLYMSYDDTFESMNNFISTTTSFNLGLGFKFPLSISSGIGTSTNMPANPSQQSTLFIVYNGKIGYKFFDKKLSTTLSGSYVIGEQEVSFDENDEVSSGIDSQKFSIKLGAQYKINSKISISMNVDRVSLIDNLNAENDKNEMRGKVKLSLNI